VLDVPVSKIVLNEPRVCPLVGQGEAAGVAEHVRMGGEGEPCPLASGPDQNPCRLAAKGASALAYEKGVRLGLHLRPLFEPCLDDLDLVHAERVRRGEALFEPGHVEHPAVDVHL